MSNTQTEASKAVVVKDTKNNVTRPSAGTSTGKVWEICDTLYAQATDENPITRARVIKAAEAEGVGKTNQRGRGNVRLLRNGGHGIESHAIAVIKDIAGDLFQAFA